MPARIFAARVNSALTVDKEMFAVEEEKMDNLRAIGFENFFQNREFLMNVTQ